MNRLLGRFEGRLAIVFHAVTVISFGGCGGGIIPGDDGQDGNNCMPIWECEQPLNGNEKDGCGRSRPNPVCDAPALCGNGVTDPGEGCDVQGNIGCGKPTPICRDDCQACLPDECLTASAGAGFVTWVMERQEGEFSLEFDIRPTGLPFDGVFGLSDGQQNDYTGYACLVRWHSVDGIQARDGEQYVSASPIGYSPDTTYHVRLTVDVVVRNYSVYITAADGVEKLVGASLRFRTDAGAVSSLDHAGVVVGSAGGSSSICGFTLRGPDDCIPNCGERACGPVPNGCGESCGSCADPMTCDVSSGQCGSCSPDCGVRVCGPVPNGCGESCGTCKNTESCNFSNGQCKAGPTGELLFNGTFEQGDQRISRNNWGGASWFPNTYNACLVRSDSLIVVPAPGERSGHVGLFTVKVDDLCNAANPTDRAMVATPKIADPEGSDRWYSFSIFVPDSFPISGRAWNMVWQQKDKNDLYVNVALYIESRDGTSRNWNIRYGVPTEFVSFDPAMSTFGWSDWIVHVKWSSSNSGAVEFFRNGISVFSKSGIRTTTDNPIHYGSIGIYRNAQTTTNQVFMTGMKIGTTRSSVE